jgi:3-deoxy-D-manno-octulosonate 8-phosphate phosphatase (KDO 8-P phosphatase)
VTSEPAVGEGSLLKAMRLIRVVAFDFDGVFTDNGVYVSEDGSEAVRCTRADGIGLRRLETVGVLPVVISTEGNPVVARRCEKLGVRCHQACADKVAVLEQLLAEVKSGWEETAFVGNDVNDAPLLKRACFPIVVRDAHPDVSLLGRYRTVARGGHGAVREVCDLIANAHETRHRL